MHKISTCPDAVSAPRPKHDTGTLTPLAAIRAKCLDCCCGSFKSVKFCTLDGVNSTRCALWPYRLGKRPATVRKGPNARFLDPASMPDAGVPLEACR
jgi:hypothetical protein